MEKPIPFIISMDWYYREDYDAILRIMTDSHIMLGSFDVLLAEAEQGEQQLKRNGYTLAANAVSAITPTSAAPTISQTL